MKLIFTRSQVALGNAPAEAISLPISVSAKWNFTGTRNIPKYNLGTRGRAMKHFLLLALILLAVPAFGNAQIVESKRVIQDPKTKIVYYVESDLRHVAALSPEGRLFWCSEVIHPPTAHDFPPSNGHRFSIISMGFSSHDDKIISIGTDMGLGAWVDINKKTGAYVSSGAD